MRSGSGQDTGVTETRPEQHPHHEDKEDAADRWDDRGQVGRQEGTAEDTRSEDKLKQTEDQSYKTQRNKLGAKNNMVSLQDLILQKAVRVFAVSASNQPARVWNWLF